MDYARAFDVQRATVEEVLAERAQRQAGASVPVGRLLVVEHDPVITVTPRAERSGHLLASPQRLAELGVSVHATDRGGDITYHGPGQLVVYPIVDLQALGLGLHEYMRALEQGVIDACAEMGLRGERDAGATGVWVRVDPRSGLASDHPDAVLAKVCAMGVRLRKWVSMHGLALNVTTNLEHFGLIVPCGLVGRSVTSVGRALGASSGVPEMSDAARLVVDALRRRMLST